MEFIVALLDRLQADRQVSLAAAASETYYATLQQYHGWIVTGTFTVALKLVPSRYIEQGVREGCHGVLIHACEEKEGPWGSSCPCCLR